ncbi:hypothetical protein V8F33_006420 [Rhypophila sp. PSN 637]
MISKIPRSFQVVASHPSSTAAQHLQRAVEFPKFENRSRMDMHNMYQGTEDHSLVGQWAVGHSNRAEQLEPHESLQPTIFYECAGFLTLQYSSAVVGVFFVSHSGTAKAEEVICRWRQGVGPDAPDATKRRSTAWLGLKKTLKTHRNKPHVANHVSIREHQYGDCRLSIRTSSSGLWEHESKRLGDSLKDRRRPRDAVRLWLF